MPPGPWRRTTCAGGSSTSSDSSRPSSRSRPTNRPASRAARRSASVRDTRIGSHGVPESSIFRSDLLAGRVALVTGGGTNLGRHAAAELAACGADVVIAGRREEVLAEAASALGDRVSWVAGDIREADGCAGMVAACLERHGRLDVLVNNAGGQYFVPAEAIAAKGWRAVMRLNVEGTLTMTHAAADALAADGGGTVVNVTVSPHHGMPAMAHTGAARAAVEALTAEFAAEWRDRGVSVIAAAIGRLGTGALRKEPQQGLRQAARGGPFQRLRRVGGVGWLGAPLPAPPGRPP